MRDDTDDTYDEDDDVDTSAQQRESKDIRLLRKKAKGYDDVIRERDDLRRELEFTKAGIPDTAQAKYFRKGYDGDMTAEAIRAAAAEVGLLQTDQDDETDEDDGEQQALGRIAAASNGASPTSVNSITPDTYAGWSRDKRLAFGNRHPDLVEALKRGEPVKAPAGV